MARFVDGEPVVGFIFCPAIDQLYYASKGNGAYCNGKSIHVSSVANHKEAIVNIGQDIVQLWDRSDIQRELMRNGRSPYMVASSSYALSQLADGKIDEALHWQQTIWDVAVPWLLVSEADGLSRTCDGRPLDLTGARANDVYFSNAKLPQDWSFLS